MQIVVVDDERLAVETLVNTIKQVEPNSKVIGFRKGEEALDFVKNNECEVVFLDIKMRGMTGLDLARRIKEVNKKINIIFVTGYSEYSIEAFRLYASDYLLKPATPDDVRRSLDNLRVPLNEITKKRIRVQCFGNFDIFVDGKPVTFKRAKAKELFAYLVDRKGASCTMGELMAIIWDDGYDTKSRQSNLRNIIFELKKTLNELGVEDIIIKGHNSISVNPELFECDYYDYLEGKPHTQNSFNGEYMMQYSWAEVTTAALLKY